MGREKGGWEKAGQVAKDIGLGALNLVGGLTGSFGNTYQNTTLNQFSPEENARRVREYRTSLGFDASNLPSKDGFEKYVANRTQSSDSFAKVTVPGGRTLADVLKGDGDAQTAVKKELDNALKLADKTNTAYEEFQEGMDKVEKAVKDPKSNFHPRNMVTYIQELKSNSTAAIKAQQADETAKLDDLFKNDEFKRNLKDSINGPVGDNLTAAQLSTIQKSMQATLKESQTKELDAFNKSIDVPVLKMQNAAKIERERVSTLARLSEQSETMRKLIEAEAQKHRQEGNPEIAIEQTKYGGIARFKGIKITDLPYIESVTGRKINHQAGKDKDGKETHTFTMDLPHRLFRADYYLSSQNNVKADMLCLVGAVKAAGYSHITLRLDHKEDPEHAMELARAAYEAAIEQGFDADKITLVVNGKNTSANEAFADCPSRLTAAHSKAGENAKANAAADREITNDVYYERFKKDLKAGRLADPVAQKEAEAVDENAADQPLAPNQQ